MAFDTAYPQILAALAERSRAKGVRMLHVSDTGKFDKRSVLSTVSVYNRLCAGAALLPPAVGFLFDRERRTDEEIESIRSKSNQIHFLTRRMFECYILHVEAISRVLGDDAGLDINAEKLTEWFASRGVDFSDASTVQKADAAGLLTDLFREISDCRVEFQKPSHPVRIVNQILELEPEFLRPLANEVLAVLGEPSKPQP